LTRIIDRIRQGDLSYPTTISCTPAAFLSNRHLRPVSRLARRIYDLKRLKHQVPGPFVEVNCATLRGDGAMSSLFGHKNTGATADGPGLLRAADTGVLFLDEIGELDLDEQAMILRAIKERRFLPVGSDKEAASDFQLIAGTNRNLMAAVAEGRFREDQFARLNLWTFVLPGLMSFVTSCSRFRGDATTTKSTV